jgi:drug/metabolite transporter (DMT)-like permease
MLALSFGLVAAVIWAVHDLLARKVAPGAALLPILVVILGAGSLVLAPISLTYGDWSTLTPLAIAISVGHGLGYALAAGALYRAFSLAPVRLVSPVIGAYPMLSLVFAAAQGREVTTLDWLAVAAIVAGIAIVANAARDDALDGYAAPPAVALGWAGLAALGFSAAFALGQEATRQADDLPVMLIGRLVALAVFLALVVRRGGPVAPSGGRFWLVALMGSIDAIALGLVTASGGLPNAEYASVASSLFGVLTVVMATWILKEHVRPIQWLGIAVVFCGIASLSFQGG